MYQDSSCFDKAWGSPDHLISLPDHLISLPISLPMAHVHFRQEALSSGWCLGQWPSSPRPKTYLQSHPLECLAPWSMALSLALTGKLHQVWKPGVLHMEKKKKGTCLQEGKSALSEVSFTTLSSEERRGRSGGNEQHVELQCYKSPDTI